MEGRAELEEPQNQAHSVVRASVVAVAIVAAVAAAARCQPSR